jgi:hypothetical protein
MHKAGKTTSFPFVNPNATTQTVAWLYHEVLWNPRPLYTPPVEKAKRKEANATIYQPLLKSWIHQFKYELVPKMSVVAAPQAAAATVTNASTKTSTSTMAASSTGSAVSAQQLHLSRAPNSSDIVSTLASHSQGAAVGDMASSGTGGHAVPQETEEVLSEIWNDVQSIKSMLNG